MEPSLSVLGPLQVIGQRGPVRLRPAQRRLLSILLTEPGAEIGRDVLLDRMWGEATPATARTSLHVHVSGLRQAVPGLISTTSTGYRVEIGSRRYDRAELDNLTERAAEHARAGDWSAVLDASSRALELWRGSPFDELRDDEFAVPEINRLTERWLDLRELHARALLAVGRNDDAIARLNELVLRHPLREPLWEQLMLVLYRSGRRAEALRAYQEARHVLAVELDVEPGHALRQLEERILFGDPALGEPERPGGADNLPWTPTSFIGREADLRHLTGLLAQDRLVTIVGGPGLGKTRLAIETGHAVAGGHPGGVWFVSLAATRNRLEMIGTILGATGLRDHAASLEGLARRLANRPALLILDNCEHQLEACRRFGDLVLSAGTELRMLATSRHALGVGGEQVWHIRPLRSPERPSGTTSAAPARANPAVRLFVDRARAVDPSLRLAPETVPLVAELCRRAGGIPLVLELAARWVHALGLDDIGEMLSAEPPGEAVSELGHHRSLTAAIEWSMALLPPEDRRLFVACSLFNGRFALEDVRAVCAPDHEPRRLARAVARLAEASLIVVERQQDGSAVYRLLGPIRELAREQLAASPDWAGARDRFVAHYLQKEYRDSHDPLQQVVDLESVDKDLDNLREAFELGLALGHADEVARMLVRLDGYTLNRYLVAERRFWLNRVLDRIGDPLDRAHALRSLGSAAQILNELDESLVIFQQALGAFRQLDDESGLAQCLLSMSGLCAARGEWAAGAAAAQEARALVSASRSLSGRAIAAYYIGENLAYGGHVSDGLPELEEAARLFSQAGELGRSAYALGTLTSVAVLSGEEDVARRSAPRALALARQSKSVYRQVRALGPSAMVEARYGDPELARTMLVEAHGLMEPYELDDVFQFLLPAAFLLRRWARWSLLFDVLVAAEEAIVSKGNGYPVPWQKMVGQWRREADALAGPPGAGIGRPSPPRALDDIVADVVEVLDGTPRPDLQARANAANTGSE